MKNFFVTMAATFVGLSLWVTILFGVLSLFIAALTSGAGGDTKYVVKENSVLHLKLNKTLVEKSKPKKDPFANFAVPFMGGDATIGLVELVEAIENAKTDDNIKGIYLDVSTVSGGFASLEVVRKALVDFKTSEKFIVAYAEVMTEGAYYITSVADEIYLYPQGALEFNGLNTNTTFYTGLLEKVGVEAKIFRVGKFKSAVEPFFRKDMSEANKAQTSSFLNSMYDHYLRQVADSRGKKYSEMKEISDSMYVRTAKDAVKYGLITKTAYYDEVLDILRTKSGVDSSAKINAVGFINYYNSFFKEVDYDIEDKIAIIVASGQIVSGENSRGNMGSETIAKAIRKARLDKDVKAIVLRVNSPGGSALASDVMWREVMLTKEEKPIIASMSDVAASGGYYISMGCNKILAEPNTITGSIGVFGLMFNMQELMNNKLGVTFDGVKTGAYSDLPDMNRAMTPFEEKIIQDGVDDIYLDFTQKAADGRGMDVEKLRSIASGRVWSGLEAKENGLVDQLGGLSEAIAVAATEAKLEKYRVQYYPKEEDPLEKLLNDMSGQAKAWYTGEQFGALAPYFNQIKNLENMQGVQARMPYDLQLIR